MAGFLASVMTSLLPLWQDGASYQALARSTTRSRAVVKTYRVSRGKSATARATSRGKSHRAQAVIKTRHVAHAKPKTRYAYPIGIFMARPPAFDSTPLDNQAAEPIIEAFNRGTADGYAARVLVRAGLVKYHPLRGGIFWRREPVKYIIMHSTETGIPIGAVRVIESWSSMGIRHPGAQYVVDRDGTIVQAVDPDLATVHINIFKTLPGINNDNSIGIEMCHAGSQDYPRELRNSVIKLVTYLQKRYNVADENIITHRYAQQGDHTDPVHFDWDHFIASKNAFKNQSIAYRTKSIKDESKSWKASPEPVVNTYLKLHSKVKDAQVEKGTPVVVPASAPIASPVTTPEVSAGEKRKLPPAPRVESKEDLEAEKKPVAPVVDPPAPMPVPTAPAQTPAPGAVEEVKPTTESRLPVRPHFAPAQSSIRYYPPDYFKQQAQSKFVKSY